MFVEDGHNNQLLKDLVTDYNNQKSSKSNYQNNIENWRYTNLKKLPWIPNIKHDFKKRYYFISGKNLLKILCQRNKQKLPPNS